MLDGYLQHHGVKGMHWGIRRYQPYGQGYKTKKEGHFVGKVSAKSKKDRPVFISGSSKTQFEDSGYYRKDLPDPIKQKLNEYVKDKRKIMVGDAPGIDRQVQDYLKSINYDNVEIYGPGKKVRYQANDKWNALPINSKYEEGSPEWLRQKDIVMTNRATEGLAVIIDEGAKATRLNIRRLEEQGKDVNVYQLCKDVIDDGFVSKEYVNELIKELDDRM